MQRCCLFPSCPRNPSFSISLPPLSRSPPFSFSLMFCLGMLSLVSTPQVLPCKHPFLAWCPPISRFSAHCVFLLTYLEPQLEALTGACASPEPCRCPRLAVRARKKGPFSQRGARHGPCHVSDTDLKLCCPRVLKQAPASSPHSQGLKPSLRNTSQSRHQFLNHPEGTD